MKSLRCKEAQIKRKLKFSKVLIQHYKRKQQNQYCQKMMLMNLNKAMFQNLRMDQSK